MCLCFAGHVPDRNRSGRHGFKVNPHNYLSLCQLCGPARVGSQYASVVKASRSQALALPPPWASEENSTDEAPAETDEALDGCGSAFVPGTTAANATAEEFLSLPVPTVFYEVTRTSPQYSCRIDGADLGAISGRVWEVGQAHSTGEASEQRQRCAGASGGSGGKGPDQGEFASVEQVLDTAPGNGGEHGQP